VGSQNNRLVWGGMTALAAIATVSADELFTNWQVLRDAVERGSVITADNGIKAVAVDADSRATYVAALEERMGDLSGAQAARVRCAINFQCGNVFAKKLSTSGPQM